MATSLDLWQDRDNTLTSVMFQLPSPKVERLPGYCPVSPDRGTPEKTSELSWRPGKRIHYPYLASDCQLPAQPQIPNPQCPVVLPHVICNLHTTGESGLLSIGFACVLANSISNYFSLYTADSWSCIFFVRRQVGSRKKNWGSSNREGMSHLKNKN